ncbi:MAG: hypothetical protein PHW15_03325 [Patescibacteria group bacterium]|nr:hypothetical protein [Patescibacteria group bacterium]MDD5589539.1 hypothetical protein [Candidatus Nanoarchaeia archaeon]
MKKVLKKADQLAILLGSSNIEIIFNTEVLVNNGFTGAVRDWNSKKVLTYFNDKKDLKKKLEMLINECYQ